MFYLKGQPFGAIRQNWLLTPFWSYKVTLENEENLLPEIIMNIIVFIPIGVLIGCAFRQVRWWMVLIGGIMMSSLIETLQYMLKRGLSEVDDVMHNTLGCLVGYGLYALVVRKMKNVR